MQTKNEKRDSAPAAQARRGMPATRQRPTRPGSARSPARGNRRGEVKNPLGDFSEQTGAFFG